jgi:hypothetical protein
MDEALERFFGFQEEWAVPEPADRFVAKKLTVFQLQNAARMSRYVIIMSHEDNRSSVLI